MNLSAMSRGVPFAERGGAMRGLLNLAAGCYPAFLFGGPVAGVLPVFHFHDVTQDWLEPRLRHLADNGYRTVTCDEIARVVVDGSDPGPRAVALTFDDAWASVFRVAFALLRHYDLKAILFAIPARIGEPQFVTWPELRQMHASGLIDVQSHTRSHAKMFSDDRVVGFVDPEFARESVLDRPLASRNGAVRFIDPTALGTPLYERRSRMSNARRFLPDEQITVRCREHVERLGGRDFFSRGNWRSQLIQLAAGAKGRFESDDAAAAAVREELAEGRAMLNERLGTSTVCHVALPWGIAGDVARRALAETGHVTAFAQRPFQRFGVHSGDDRFQLARLNGRFLPCLPGRGRRWFFSAA